MMIAEVILSSLILLVPWKGGHCVPELLGIGRTSAYALVKEGHFKVVRIGNAIRVSKRSFDAWLDEQTF